MIKFPKLHIAESVLNRIANTLEERGPLGLGTNKPANAIPDSETMIPPNPAVLGAEINNQVKTLPGPVAVPPEQQDAANSGMLDAAVTGGNAFDGALLGAGRSF